MPNERRFSFVVHVGGVRCLWTAATNGPIVHLPGTCVYGEPRCNGIDRVKPKNSEKNLSQCQFVYHKSHMDRAGREPGSPLWEAGD
jgi:hypothetical protein